MRRPPFRMPRWLPTRMRCGHINAVREDCVEELRQERCGLCEWEQPELPFNTLSPSLTRPR